MSVANPRVVLIGFEPVVHDLLLDRLRADFANFIGATGLDEALSAARGATAADRLLIDTDGCPQEPAGVIAKLRLVSAAPIVVLSATVAPGSATASAFLQAGASALVAKPAGALPLAWHGEAGEPLLRALREALTR